MRNSGNSGEKNMESIALACCARCIFVGLIYTQSQQMPGGVVCVMGGAASSSLPPRAPPVVVMPPAAQRKEGGGALMAPWSIKNRVVDTAWAVIAQKTLGIPTMMVFPKLPLLESSEDVEKKPAVAPKKKRAVPTMFQEQFNIQFSMLDLYVSRKYLEKYGQQMGKDLQEQWGMGDAPARLWALRKMLQSASLWLRSGHVSRKTEFPSLPELFLCESMHQLSLHMPYVEVSRLTRVSRDVLGIHVVACSPRVLRVSHLIDYVLQGKEMVACFRERFHKQVIIASKVLGPLLRGYNLPATHSDSQAANRVVECFARWVLGCFARCVCVCASHNHAIPSLSDIFESRYGYVPPHVRAPLVLEIAARLACQEIVPMHMTVVDSSNGCMSSEKELQECMAYMIGVCTDLLGRVQHWGGAGAGEGETSWGLGGGGEGASDVKRRRQCSTTKTATTAGESGDGVVEMMMVVEDTPSPPPPVAVVVPLYMRRRRRGACSSSNSPSTMVVIPDHLKKS